MSANNFPLSRPHTLRKKSMCAWEGSNLRPQSYPPAKADLKFLEVGVGGIEPPTSVLSGLRSTTELHTQKFQFVRRAGQDCALPLSYTRSPMLRLQSELRKSTSGIHRTLALPKLKRSASEGGSYTRPLISLKPQSR